MDNKEKISGIAPTFSELENTKEIGVGDLVEIISCKSNWYPGGKQEKKKCFKERYEGLPKEYYMKGVEFWPNESNPTDGWKYHQLEVADGLVGQVVHIWFPGEGAFPCSATRILIETSHKGELFYVPIRTEGVKILSNDGTIKPAKRD